CHRPPTGGDRLPAVRPTPDRRRVTGRPDPGPGHTGKRGSSPMSTPSGPSESRPEQEGDQPPAPAPPPQAPPGPETGQPAPAGPAAQGDGASPGGAPPSPGATTQGDGASSGGAPPSPAAYGQAGAAGPYSGPAASYGQPGGQSQGYPGYSYGAASQPYQGPQGYPGQGSPPGYQEPQQPHQHQAQPAQPGAPAVEPSSDSAVRATLAAVRGEVAKAVVGQDAAVTGLVIALLCRGHVLLEGVPGVAKTLLTRTLGAALELEMKRVQFTPDLMPGDVTGSLVYDARTAEFSFREGPVFTNLMLADEINRTPPKTQASLLEAMEERQVSV